MRVYPGLSVWALRRDHECHKKAQEGLAAAEDAINVTTETRCEPAGVEGGGRGREPRDAGLGAGKGKDVGCPLHPREGAGPPDTDFSP